MESFIGALSLLAGLLYFYIEKYPKISKVAHKVLVNIFAVGVTVVIIRLSFDYAIQELGL